MPDDFFLPSLSILGLLHPVCVCMLSCVQLFATPWTAEHQAPLSMGCSRQEYWNGLPFPSLGDLPDPGIELGSPALQADSLPSKPPCSFNTNGAKRQYVSELAQLCSNNTLFTKQAGGCGFSTSDLRE